MVNMRQSFFRFHKQLALCLVYLRYIKSFPMVLTAVILHTEVHIIRFPLLKVTSD